MNKTYLKLLVLLLMPVVSGCSVYHINSKDLVEEFYPSKGTVNDVVYLETIDRPNDVIAEITVNAERRQRINEVLEKMKREAAILGADAITDIKTDATGQWKSLPAQHLIGNGYVRANFMASAVIYK